MSRAIARLLVALSSCDAYSPALAPHASMRPSTLSPTMKADAPKNGGSALPAFAALWVAAHAMPILPAGAVDAIDDDMIMLDAQAGGLGFIQYAALAVTAISILPTPGMLGLGEDDVQKGSEQKKGFGFQSIDDVIAAARDAGSGDDDKPKGGGRTPPPKMWVASSAVRTRAGSSSRPRSLAGGARMMATAEEERREKLAQLFGTDAASRIAEQTSEGGSKTAAAEEEVEIQMLQEGMQQLSWGAIRLVDVSMAPGPLEASFVPVLPDGTSQLLCVRLDMPLGMLIEEAEEGEAAAGNPVVGELLEDSSAAAGGVAEGDVIRATTGVIMGMSYPTWQLMMGGVGKPSLQKVLMPTEGEPFEKTMAAIGSNSQAQQGNGQVVLVLERKLPLSE